MAAIIVILFLLILYVTIGAVQILKQIERIEDKLEEYKKGK
jgi:cell division protein FtsL